MGPPATFTQIPELSTDTPSPTPIPVRASFTPTDVPTQDPPTDTPTVVPGKADPGTAISRQIAPTKASVTATPRPTRKPKRAKSGPAATPTPTLVPPPVPVYAKRSSLPKGKPGAYAVPVPTAPASCYMYGLNLSGGEWGRVRPESPDVYGSDYTYPTVSELDYLKSKGLLLVRLNLKWEHLQKSLYGPLDTAELARLDDFMQAASERGMWVWPEPHNNARYYGHLLGSSEVPYSGFADFWGKMAKHLRTQPSLYAYDLTDEPHDTGGLWPGAAQAAIDAIRLYDMGHPIVVGGDGWSSAENWLQINDGLRRLKDPAGNLIFDAHVFFDSDSSGTYQYTYDDEEAYPEVGVDRVRPFVEWLAANKLHGIIGGYGVPDDDPRWLPVLENFLSYIDSAGIGGAYWAGGPWWGDYPLAAEPRDGIEQPQMTVLQQHTGNCPR